jgi:cobalt-zinc-cadmium efflux system membrane fusion protein
MKNIIAICAMVFTLNGCNETSKDTSNSAASAVENMVSLTDEQLKNAGVELGKAEIKSLSSTIKVSGIVDVPPQNLISISFPLGGFLKGTQLLPGMRVFKGQVIATIENESFIQLQQDYLTSVSKRDYLQKEYERQKSLNAIKATSDKAFEQIQAEFQQEKVKVDALREKLLMLGADINDLKVGNIRRGINITSPITGYVSTVNVNVGKFINPTDVLFELVNPTDLHLALTVFEKDLPLLQPGLRVKAYPSSNSDKVYRAETLLTGKKLDESRSTVVHCHFVGTTEELLPGMYLNAEIELPAQPAYTVPEGAVVRSGAKEYVMLARDRNDFEMIEVSTRVSQYGYVQIITERKNFNMETLVLKNAYTIYMKLKNKKEG